MSHSNCLIWAVALYWRRSKKGAAGYLVMRRSRWGRFPHFLYMEKGRLYSYVPVGPRPRLLPPPLFEGKSKFGDL